MMSSFGMPIAAHAKNIFDSISEAFSIIFLMYKALTLKLLVFGMGPIPTFLPPFVPVGPVMGGFSLPIPCALLTIPLPTIPSPFGYNIITTPFRA